MKNLLIFGDSYSTFAGCIPEGYGPYYPCLDVLSAENTWWHLLCEDGDFCIVRNDSWSGSTVCNMGYNGDCSKENSFIYRLETLMDEGFFEKISIDKVLVFGGTNDSWSGNSAGGLQFSDWSQKDLLLILPGYSYFINRLLGVMNKEKILAVINSDMRDEVSCGIIKICEHYGIEYVALADVEKENGHPTRQGMIDIKDQILRVIK